MQSFRDVYAAAQEVKCIEDAVGLVCENRWLQCFGLGGNVVVCLCVESGTAVLRVVLCANSEQTTQLLPHVLKQLAKACADVGLSFRVEC